jgi:predicted DNA-binding transcriptional regulator AlpA
MDNTEKIVELLCAVKDGIDAVKVELTKALGAAESRHGTPEIRPETAKDAGPEAELLTAQQAWESCNLSKSAWYKAKSSGKIPSAVRIGGALRWRRDELRDWFRAGCPPVTLWTWPEQGPGRLTATTAMRRRR